VLFLSLESAADATAVAVAAAAAAAAAEAAAAAAYVIVAAAFTTLCVLVALTESNAAKVLSTKFDATKK